MPSDVNLGIDLDIKDALQTAEELEKAVEKIGKDKREVPQVMNIKKQIKGDIQAVHELKDELRDLQSQGYESKFEEAIIREEQKLDSYRNSLANVRSEMESLASSTFPTAETAAYNKELDTLDAKYTKLSKVRKELDADIGKQVRDLEKAFTQGQQDYTERFNRAKLAEATGQTDNSQYRRDVREMNEIEAKLKEIQETYQNITTSNPDWLKLQETEQALDKITDRADYLREVAIPDSMVSGTQTAEYQKLQGQQDAYTQKIQESTERIVQLREKDAQAAKRWSDSNQREQEKVIQSIDKHNDSVKQAIVKYNELDKAAQKAGKSGSKSFSTMSKGASNLLRSLKRGAITIAGLVLGAHGLFSIVRKIRSAILEGFKEVANGDKEFKAQIDSIKDAWAEVKVSLAAAFKPIVEMAIPYIQQLLAWVQQLIGYIASFTALIAGQNSYTKAIKKTGEAAAGASKQLSKFDELNNLSSGSGGGESGFNFEQVPVDSKVLDWLDKIKDTVGAIKDRFMELVGTPFLEGLQPEKTKKLFLDLIDDSKQLALNVKKIFDNPELQAAQEKFAKSASHTFGSLTGLGTDLALILGDALVDGLNKFLEDNQDEIVLDSVKLTDDWTALSDQLGGFADALREIFSVLHDNEDLTETISNLFGALWDIFVGIDDSILSVTKGFTDMFTLPITDNVDEWKTSLEDLFKVTNDLSGLIGSIAEDVGGWLSTLGESIGNFFTKVGTVLSGITEKALQIWDKIYPVIQVAIQEIKEIWEEYLSPIFDDVVWILDKVIDAVGTAIQKIWEWLEPFVQWFIDYIVPVIVPILKTIITTVGTLIKVSLIPLRVALTAIKSIIQLLSGDVEGAKETWQKFGEGIKQSFENIGNKFKDLAHEMQEGLKNLWENIKIKVQEAFQHLTEKWEEFWENVFDFWSGVITKIKDKFTEIVDAIKNKFKEVGDKAKTLFTETLPGFFDNIKQKFNNLKTNLQTGVNNIITFFTNLKTKLSTIVNNIKTFFTNLGTFFSNLFTQTIPNIFKKGVNLAIGFINKLIDGVQSAVNLIINALNQLNWNVPKWVPGIGGQSFGFNISPASFNRIPALASGTVIPPSMGDFIARLGDNNRETEVVSPLSTIKQALSEAMQEMNFGGDISVNLVVDGKVLANTVVKQDNLARMARGVGLFGT